MLGASRCIVVLHDLRGFHMGFPLTYPVFMAQSATTLVVVWKRMVQNKWAGRFRFLAHAGGLNRTPTTWLITNDGN